MASGPPRAESRCSLRVAILLTVLIGGVTFSGSLVAYGKLAGTIAGRPLLYKGQNVVNAVLLLASVALGVLFCMQDGDQRSSSDPMPPTSCSSALWFCRWFSACSPPFPIGGADMPVVICLLNSYSGLAACAAGFVIGNTVLIVSGSLVGASGIILTRIMCKAMNRSLANVLFSGFGAARPHEGRRVSGRGQADQSRATPT